MEGTAPRSQTIPVQRAAAANGEGHGSTASPPPSTSLHSVRKAPAKPWKKPAALPIPPRVYRVEPRGFRELVQRLTGAPELAPRHLKDAAPTPLELAPRLCTPPPQPLQQLAATSPVQAYLQGGADLPSSSSTLEFTSWFPAGEVAATIVAEPPQMNTDAGYQSQVYTAGVPSPSLYSAYLTWCNMPPLSPGSMACLEQSTVL